MSATGEDDISRRLRAADPAPSGLGQLPSGRRIEDLVEQTMATRVDDMPRMERVRRRWVAAAATVIVAGAGAGAYLATRGSDSASHTPSVLSLKVPAAAAPRPGGPGGPGGATCIRFTVGDLAKQELAFSGTVTSLRSHDVELTVDHWYKGGTADQVDLATVGEPGAVNELGIDFGTGKRYLVSARDGAVTGCGYSGEYSSGLAAAFEQAFRP